MECNPRVECHAAYSSQDALFIVRNGTVNSGKHIALGMAVKSVTDSRKLLTMLNKFGHIINYHAVEELETALGEAIQARKLAFPEGAVAGVLVGLAFDSLASLLRLSGADTLQDTMGILYQNRIPQAVASDRTTMVNSEKNMNKATKRKLQVVQDPLEPYRKKPRMTMFSYVATDLASRPYNVKLAEDKDLAWMMCRHLGYQKHTNVGRI